MDPLQDPLSSAWAVGTGANYNGIDNLNFNIKDNEVQNNNTNYGIVSENGNDYTNETIGMSVDPVIDTGSVSNSQKCNEKCQEDEIFECQLKEPNSIFNQKFFLDTGMDLSIAGSTPGRILVSRQNWIPDNKAQKCFICLKEFTAFRRRHHCRRCGRVICDNCSLVYSGNGDSTTDSVLLGLDRACRLCYHVLGNSIINTKYLINPEVKSEKKIDFSLPEIVDMFNGYGNLISNSFMPTDFIDSLDYLMVSEYVRALRNCVYYNEVKNDLRTHYPGLLRRMILLLAAGWKVILTAESVVKEVENSKKLISTKEKDISIKNVTKKNIILKPMIGVVTYTGAEISEKGGNDIRKKLDIAENEMRFIEKSVENMSLANAGNLVTQITGFFINFTSSTDPTYASTCVDLGLVESLIPGLSTCIDFVKKEQAVWCLRNIARIPETVAMLSTDKNVIMCLTQCLSTPCKNLTEFTLSIVGSIVKSTPIVARKFMFTEITENDSTLEFDKKLNIETTAQKISVYNNVTNTRFWYIPTDFIEDVTKAVDMSNMYTLQSITIRCVHSLCLDSLCREYILTKTALIQKIMTITINTSIYQQYSRLCNTAVSQMNIYGSNSTGSAYIDNSDNIVSDTFNMYESGLSGIGLVGSAALITCSFNKLGYSMSTPFITGALASEIAPPTTNIILNNYIQSAKALNSAVSSLQTNASKSDMTKEVKELYGELLHINNSFGSNQSNKQKRLDLERGYVKAACYSLLNSLISFYYESEISLEEAKTLVLNSVPTKGKEDSTLLVSKFDENNIEIQKNDDNDDDETENITEKIKNLSSGLSSKQTKERIQERIEQIKKNEIVSGILLETLKKQYAQLKETCTRFISSPALEYIIKSDCGKNVMTPAGECTFIPYMILNNREFIRNILMEITTEESCSGAEGIDLLIKLLTYNPKAFFAVFVDANNNFKVASSRVNVNNNNTIIISSVEEILSKLLVDNFSLILERVFVIPSTTAVSKKFLTYLCEIAVNGTISGKPLSDQNDLQTIRLCAKKMAGSIQDNNKYIGVISINEGTSSNTLYNKSDSQIIFNEETFSKWKKTAQTFLKQHSLENKPTGPITASSAKLADPMENFQQQLMFQKQMQNSLNFVNITGEVANPTSSEQNIINDVEVESTINGTQNNVDMNGMNNMDPITMLQMQQQWIYMYIMQLQQMLTCGNLQQEEVIQVQNQMQLAYMQSQYIQQQWNMLQMQNNEITVNNTNIGTISDNKSNETMDPLAINETNIDNSNNNNDPTVEVNENQIIDPLASYM